MKYCFTFLTCLYAISLIGQLDYDEWHYGVQGGVTLNQISGINSMIIPGEFSTETYSTKSDYRLGYTASFFLYHRFRNQSQNSKGSRFAIQPGVSYSINGGDFNYSDINGLDYTIQFNYQYFNVYFLTKIYPGQDGGFFVTFGPQLGINVNQTAIDYVSNMPELGPDLQVTQSLREVLKGSTNFSVFGGIGFETKSGFMIEARYGFGLSDVIETQANGFRFIENKNRQSGAQLTIGYAIPFYN